MKLAVSGPLLAACLALALAVGLWAAVLNAQRGASNVVFLTLLGGGAFGNPGFARALEFRWQFDGAVNYLTASLAPSELDSIFAALQAGDRGVNLTFENGDTWRIPPPERKEAAAAITRCWNEALSGTITAA